MLRNLQGQMSHLPDICLSPVSVPSNRRAAAMLDRRWHGVCVSQDSELWVTQFFGRFCQRGFIDHFSEEKEIEEWS